MNCLCTEIVKIALATIDIIASTIKITRHREMNISPPEKKDGVVQVKPFAVFEHVKVNVSVCINFSFYACGRPAKNFNLFFNHCQLD